MLTSKSMYWMASLFLLLSVFMGLSSTSLTTIWFMLEVNMLSFLAMCLSTKSAKWEVIPKYFIVQSAGSAGILSSLLLSSEMYFFYLDALILMFLMLKLGGWPFYSWFLGLSTYMNKSLLFTFLSVQKILPVYFFNFCSLTPIFSWVVLANALWSTMMVIYAASVHVLLSLSSMYSLSWILLSSSQFSLVMLYMTSYMFMLWPIVMLVDVYSMVNNKAFVKLNFYSSLMFGLFSFSLMGLPPSMMFFVKLALLNFISQIFGVMVSFFLLMMTGFFIYAYSALMLEGISLSKSIASVDLKSNYSFNIIFFLMWGFSLLLLILEGSMKITLYLH